VLDIPKQGCLNIHASLLPRWRGAAPIQRCLEAGDAATGVTIMRMEAGLDTGPMLLAYAIKVGAGETAPDGSPPNTETASTLHDKLALLGGRLIVLALQQLDSLKSVPQSAEGVTYASKIDKAEAAIDWTKSAAEIERRIRAFDPFPGCTAQLGDSTIKLWRAEMAAGTGQPGETPGKILAVAPDGITVACGEGALRLVELQKPGGRRLASADFLHGFPMTAGQKFT
jgi:methionyl-tRNA formyltransferase